MKENNMIDLLLQLKSMSSQELEDMFRAESEKENSDFDLMVAILHILEERTEEAPVDLTPTEEAAWKNYQKRIASRAKKHINHWKPVLRAACILLIAGLLFFIVPQQVEADSFWGWIAGWTDEFFSFFNPYTKEKPQDEYVFQTDNEGLQQVYDAVIGLGITDPVVPMWLPEGYELIECKLFEDALRRYVVANFSNTENCIVFNFAINFSHRTRQYPKDQSNIETFEINGVNHHILQNDGVNVIIWTREKNENSIAMDCQGDAIYKILMSIYEMEGIE